MTTGNQYRATSKAAQAMFTDGVFDHEFTVDEENDWLAAGAIEIVPRPYRVLSNNYAAGAPGDVFEAAFLQDIEAMLIQGGHIERVRRDAAPTVDPSVDEDAKPVKKTATKT